MTILLDTHEIIWCLTDGKFLTDKVRTLVCDSANRIFFSAASIWEVEIKHAKDKARMPVSGEQLALYCRAAGYEELPITAQHALAVKGLRVKEGAAVNGDPFDRILLAQAKTEGMTLLTHDRAFKSYDEPCVTMA